jgi:hypothetical protein
MTTNQSAVSSFDLNYFNFLDLLFSIINASPSLCANEHTTYLVSSMPGCREILTVYIILKEFWEISLAHMLHHIFINYIKFPLLHPN